MKKSCSVKESKVVTTKDAKNAVNISRDNSQEYLTDEEVLINKKLSESGIEDEGLGWLEKTNIYRTINVSLGISPRSSPRLAKSGNTKPVKWVENSFENTNQKDIRNEKLAKTKPTGSETASTRKFSSLFPSNKPNQEGEESELKSEVKSVQKQDLTDLQGNAENNSDSSKLSKKVCHPKVLIEENSKGCNSSAEGVGQGLNLGKKRASQVQVDSLDHSKKQKMEETNNGVSSEEESPLQVELEMERKKRSEPFELRDIKTIVSDCELRNRMWKETFSQYKCPTRWGMPIVRNCSEKWDGKLIPPKLLHRFQKYLSSNNLTHPIFLPDKPDANADSNKNASELNSQLSTSTNSESQSEVNDSGEGSSVHGELERPGLENDLNASTSGKEIGDGMVLRNRSQQRAVISDEEQLSSDDSDDWFVKQRSTKKQKFNAKNKKASEQSNKQLVLKLERCNLNKGNRHEGGRKNGNKNDVGFSGGSVVASNALIQPCGNAKSAPDPDTMICPICSLRFRKQFIESHATECASKTYKD